MRSLSRSVSGTRSSKASFAGRCMNFGLIKTVQRNFFFVKPEPGGIIDAAVRHAFKRVDRFLFASDLFEKSGDGGGDAI
jgi:hypothetical protein